MNETTRRWRKAYNCWKNMLSRCNNPQDIGFKHYGGRGIKVCEDWVNFKGFFDWFNTTYEEGRTIDRRDNNKGYSQEKHDGKMRY